MAKNAKEAKTPTDIVETAQVIEVAPVQATIPPYSIVLSPKQAVKVSAIGVAKATLKVIQSGCVLFTRSTEGLSLSESFAQLSNIFHYQFKGKKVKLDKFNPLVLELTFGEALYTVSKPAKPSMKNGGYPPHTSVTVGSLLKVLYHNFAADVLERVTVEGNYFNYVHAANVIANFTRIPEHKAKVATAK